MSANSGYVFGSLIYCFCFIGHFEVVTLLQCYSCPSTKTAEGCQTISSCGPDQVCMLRRTVINQTQEIFYESRCEGKVDCDLELDRYTAILSALVGRKRAMNQVLAGDICLIQCCDQDLCNNGCIKPTDRPLTAAVTFDTNTQPATETVTTNGKLTSQTVTTNTQPATETVTKNGRLTSQTVTTNTQPATETVTKIGKLTSQTVTKNTQPATETVTTNGRLTSQTVTTNTQPVIEEVTTNGKLTPHIFSANTQPATETVTTNGKLTSQTFSANTQPATETVTTNGKLTSQTYSANAQPATETVTTNGELTSQTFSANTQPATKTVTTNGKLTSQTVTTNTQPVTETVTTNGKLTSQTYSANTLPATETVTTNGKLTSQTYSANTQPATETVTTNGKLTSQTFSANTQPATETVTTNGKLTSQTFSANTQPATETVTTNGKLTSQTVTSNTQPSTETVATNGKLTSQTVTANTQQVTETVPILTKQHKTTKATNTKPSSSPFNTNTTPAFTMSSVNLIPSSPGTLTTRTPGEILVPTKPSKVTTNMQSASFTFRSSSPPPAAGSIYTGFTITSTDNYNGQTTIQSSESKASSAFTTKTPSILQTTKVTVSEHTSDGHIDITTKSSSTSDCPYGSLISNTSCYMFGRHEMTFRDAKMFCAKYHSHLVHVDTPDENEFLKKHFMEMHRGPVQYWIGITDEETEKVWRFYDSGKEASFYNWSPGEPDGIQTFDGNANADCAVFDPFLNFQWRDEDCSPYQYSEPVCEISKP